LTAASIVEEAFEVGILKSNKIPRVGEQLELKVDAQEE
jgi:hypothetical protein